MSRDTRPAVPAVERQPAMMKHSVKSSAGATLGRAAADRPAGLLHRKLYQRRFFPVLLQLPCVVVALGTFAFTEDPVITLYVGGGLALCTYLLLTAVEVKRAPTVVSPLSFYFLWESVGLGAAAISIGNRLASHEPLALAGFEVTPDHVAAGYVITMVGSCLFHAGIQVVRPLPKSVEEVHLPQNGVRQGVFLLASVWAIGVIVRLAGNPSGPLGAAFGIASWGSSAALCTYALSSPQENGKPRLSWLLVTLGVAVEFAFNIASFSKAFIMLSFIPLLWTFVYFRGLWRWLIPAGAFLVSFYFVIVAPVIQSSRNEGPIREDETTTSRILRHYTDLTTGGRDDVLDQIVVFFERQFDPLPVGFIHGEAQRYGFRHGETMDSLAYAFIPRILWPEKPRVTRGAWFAVYLGQGSNEQDVTTSTGQTAIGELYWNFGTTGVILGMLFLGMVAGLLWRIAGAVPQADPLRMLVFLSTILVMIDTPEAIGSFVGMVHRILMMGPLIWLWDRRGRQHARRTGTAVRSPMARLQIQPTHRAGEGQL